jgi:hypothetical protein
MSTLMQATQIFDDAVSEEMATIMHDFVAAKDATSVADFASALMDSAFEVMPSAAGSSKSPPKANVRSFCIMVWSVDLFLVRVPFELRHVLTSVSAS